jgi:release factor glutamine methyltransferase
MSAPASSSAQIWTVRELLKWTTDFLRKKGVESAAFESRLLMGHALKCTPIEVVTRYDEEPADSDRTAFRELIRRRVDGWPVAYLTGSKDFYLLKFDVSPAVLIPRPDTETLVQHALDFLKGKAQPKILDLGTGSGCIAISLAHRCKTAEVLATDVSPDALTVAAQNAKKHGVSERVSFRKGDLFAAVPEESKFDLIVSNPPYIAPSEIETLAPDVKDHEPRLALDGGPDGLAYYRRIAADAGRFLESGAGLALEIGYQQESAVREIFSTTGEWSLGSTIPDMAGRPRVITAKKK